jgi:glucan 1,3-beta-glucosidase
VVISDAFRPLDWQDTMPTQDFLGTWLDVHMYQAFGQANERRSIEKHLFTVKREWPQQLQTVSEFHTVIVGEWSLGLPPKAFRGMDERERDLALKAFATLQLEAFQHAQGWFFWSYKTENSPGWSFRDCVQRGWLDVTNS